MILRKKRIRKRNRQKRSKKSLFLFLLFFVAAGSISSLLFFLFHGHHLVSPLPKTGSLRVSQSSQDQVIENKIKQELQSKGMTVESSKVVSNAGIITTLETGEEITFSRQKDISSQIASLQVIMTELTMVGKRFSKLDLRFDKPVIVLK